MNPYRSFTADDAVRVAAAALSRESSEAVVIDKVSELGGDQCRNLIVRASAVDPQGVARAIIVKATRAADYDPSAENAYATSGLVKEWAAATLLARQAARAGQRGALLAADVAQGVLVFRDHGEDLPSLVRPLLHGSADDAERALTAFALALARLHAATIGCRDDHAEIVRSDFPAAMVPPPARDWINRVPRKVIALLGGSIPDDELMLMAGRLQSPGPWLALVHGDPCPDNVLLTADGTAELVDFEFAGPGHALLDATYWWMSFPTCWCAGRIPAEVSERIDSAYRAALIEAVPAAADEHAFQQERAIISAIWLLGSLEWLLEAALAQDTDWGMSSRRSRILYYLEVAIRMCGDAGILAGTCRAASAWLDDLRNRWPSSAPLAAYSAFTGSVAEA